MTISNSLFLNLPTLLTISISIIITIFSSQLSQSATITSTSQYLLPILKDSTKPQYFTQFLFGSPPFLVSLSIDLSNPWSWFTCHLVGFNSSSYLPVPNTSTYSPVQCVNATCTSYGSHFCYDCNFESCAAAKGRACGAEVDNPYQYTHHMSGRQVSSLLLDKITIHKSNKPSPIKTQLASFPFTCAYYSELKGLSQYTKGILSLAWKDTTLPGLISKTFNVPRKFALCLPSSSVGTGINGAIYFGGSPYFLSPSKIDLSKSFSTTPLVVNPVDIGVTFYKDSPSVEYFFNVRSIQVGGTTVKFNTSLLKIDKNGIGGAKLSTIDGYTTLHSQIYDVVIAAFVSKAAAMNITRVAAVGSFGACFKSRDIVESRTGPNVPVIDLVLDEKNSWRIYGTNSIIKVSSEVKCLAFLDGGDGVKTSIVIGGKQMEDNLIEFDLEGSKLGVTSSLLLFGTSCSRFKGV